MSEVNSKMRRRRCILCNREGANKDHILPKYLRHMFGDHSSTDPLRTQAMCPEHNILKDDFLTCAGAERVGELIGDVSGPAYDILLTSLDVWNHGKVRQNKRQRRREILRKHPLKRFV